MLRISLAAEGAAVYIASPLSSVALMPWSSAACSPWLPSPDRRAVTWYWLRILAHQLREVGHGLDGLGLVPGAVTEMLGSLDVLDVS